MKFIALKDGKVAIEYNGKLLPYAHADSYEEAKQFADNMNKKSGSK